MGKRYRFLLSVPLVTRAAVGVCMSAHPLPVLLGEKLGCLSFAPCLLPEFFCSHIWTQIFSVNFFPHMLRLFCPRSPLSRIVSALLLPKASWTSVSQEYIFYLFPCWRFLIVSCNRISLIWSWAIRACEGIGFHSLISEPMTLSGSRALN